jgi:hypothetical protein
MMRLSNSGGHGRGNAVVIGESHNLIGGTSLRKRVARLLDPAAIADVDNYTPADIAYVHLRHTKISQRFATRSASSGRAVEMDMFASSGGGYTTRRAACLIGASRNLV